MVINFGHLNIMVINFGYLNIIIINFGYLNIMIISFLQSVITSLTHENVRRSDTSASYVRVL